MGGDTKEFEPALRRRLSGGALPHAWLISGGTREVRRRAGQWLASACVCTAAGNAVPCFLCSGCHKARQGIHPDIITVAGESGKSITIAQARQARADAFVLPNEARRKVYLFPDADEMSHPVQNALLKLLEEGPAFAVFLLLADNKERMLSTVRSRCESLILTGGWQQAAPEQIVSAASRLAEALLHGDAVTLLETVVPMEKLEREEFEAVIEETMHVLHKTLGQQPARVIPLLQKLKTIQEACRFHVGTGHLAGLLFVKQPD